MNRHRAILLMLFGLTAYLCLARLNEPALWDDEAHVALFAHNFLQTGHWSAWDGRNLSGADRNGMYLDDQLRHVLPQIDYVVAAMAFQVFGVSTWAARILFALFGLAGLGLFYWWMKIEAPGRKMFHLYSVAMLGLSVTYLLNVRTCRYYSIAIFFILLAMIAYAKYMAGRKWRWLVVLAVASAALFYSSALICGAFLFAIGVRHLLFNRRACSARDWGLIGGCAVLFLTLILPYALTCVHAYMQARQLDVAATSHVPVGGFQSRATLFWWNLRELNAIHALAWPVALGLVIWYFLNRSSDSKSSLRQWAALAIAYVAGIAILSPQPVEITQIADVRYLVPFLPVFAAFTGVALAEIHSRSALIAIASLIFLLVSNAASAMGNEETVRSLLPAFLGEIHSPFPTAVSETSKYLRSHAKKDESIFVLPESGQKPMIFHAGDYVKIRGILSQDTRLPKNLINELDPSLFTNQATPDWIISLGDQEELKGVLKFFSRPVHERGSPVQYHYTLVERLPVYWDDTQRPELMWHTFGPKTEFDRKEEGVLIFKRSLKPL